MPTPEHVEGRIHHPYGGPDDPRRSEARIAELATAQHGVIAYRQLLGVGLTPRQIDRRLSTGGLISMHRGVYAVGHTAIAREGRWLAAVLTCGPEAALSHTCAAALQGLLPPSPAAVHVTVPVRDGRARPGVRVHRAASLTTNDITEENGIPCTSVARTLVDLAGVVRPGALERAVDEAEIRQVLDVGAILAVLDHVARPRGVRALRAILARDFDGPIVTRSTLERRFLALCRRHGLPRAGRNVHVALGDGRSFEVDVLFPNERVIVELDGLAFHHTRAAFQRDRRRDADLAALGYRTLRFTWEDVNKHPERTASLIRAVLRRGSSGPP